MPEFDYTVDGESQSTTQHVLTPTQILKDANIDPTTHYLVEIAGKNQISFKDKPSEQIHMHEHMTFISVSLGPTTVSYL